MVAAGAMRRSRGTARGTADACYTTGVDTRDPADPLRLITVDPQVAHGQACIAGTRIMVSVVLDCLAAGMTEREIIAEYPGLNVEAIRAAAAYGSRLAREEFISLEA